MGSSVVVSWHSLLFRKIAAMFVPEYALDYIVGEEYRTLLSGGYTTRMYRGTKEGG